MNLVRMFAQTSVLASMVLTSLSIYSNPVSAQQRACVITDEGATVCGKLTTPNKKPNSSSGYRKEVDKFVFLLKGCRRLDTNIKCSVTITNKGAEKQVYVGADNSGIVDSVGKSYPGSVVDIGGQNSREQNRSGIHQIISTGIDYIADMTFENVPEQITQAPLLNLYLNDRNVQYRNVSFSN